MVVIGVSGSINSGKDLVGSIIQYLTSGADKNMTLGEYIGGRICDSDYVIVKFADKLKEMLSVLLCCKRSDFEDRDFKDKKLGPEWDTYITPAGVVMTRGEYVRLPESERDGVVRREMTPRLMLQLVGTECFRNIISPDTWVISTFSNMRKMAGEIGESGGVVNFVITDVRYVNEADAIRENGGTIIRVIRGGGSGECDHSSETGLDSYGKFDHVVHNDGSIDDLCRNIKQFLISRKIIIN